MALNTPRLGHLGDMLLGCDAYLRAGDYRQGS